ncbi:lysine decarboxylase, partial [Fibrobacterota bacterium]
MPRSKQLLQAFDNPEYLHSRDGRNVRVLAEFSEPKHRLEKYGILDTIVFFGSARTLPMRDAKKNLRELKLNPKAKPAEIKKAKTALEMSRYYEEAADLSHQLGGWAKSL